MGEKQVTLHGHPIEVGDRVADAVRGGGVVVRLNDHSLHKIVVKFGTREALCSYTQNGYFDVRDVRPSLYRAEAPMPAPEDCPPPPTEKARARVVETSVELLDLEEDSDLQVSVSVDRSDDQVKLHQGGDIIYLTPALWRALRAHGDAFAEGIEGQRYATDAGGDE